MAELARGTVLDRPWGRTLASLGLRGLTGQLTVIADAREFHVAFDQGAVVASSSPLASDAAARVALTAHLISSTQVGDITRRQAAAPGRDEIDVLAEAARLGPDHAMRLRRRVVAQRAARTFSIERGDFVVRDEISLPIIAGSELDIRSIVFLGAKQMLSEARLNSELGQLGAWFQLKPEALEDLAQFGFSEAERPVLDALNQGAGLAELERPGLDQRIVRAVVYALASCGACVVEAHARAPVKKAAPPRKPPVDPIDPATLPHANEVEATTLRRAAGAGIEAPTSTRARNPSQAPAARVNQNEAQTAEVEALIRSRLAVLDERPDHFALLGVAREATPAQLRNAYFALARSLHPDKLSALGIADDTRRAQRLFAEVNTAFAVLSDKQRREEYLSVLSRGGEAAIRAEQAQAEAMAERVLESEEAFRRGELALRRDQISTAIRELEHAIELNPDEPDYHAALAWGRFCAADDKIAIAQATRATLEQAIRKAPKAARARFYLGRVERMLGRDQEALRHFQDVLKLSPNHAEATSEVRVLETRLGGDKGGGGGLFGRLKR